MHPSSSSSSSHGSMGPSGGGGGGLIRYGSAPGSFLTTAVDSVIGPNSEFSTAHVGYFSSDTSESGCKANNNTAATDPREAKGSNGLQRSSSYGLNDDQFRTAASKKLKSGVGVGVGGSSLVRHSSSPAGFLNRLATASAADNGFSVTRGIGSYDSKGGSDTVCGISVLNSQLSFTRQDSLSQITEENEDAADGISSDGHRKAAHSYATASFGMGSWDDTSAIIFSAPPGKQSKSIRNDIANGLNIMESQFQFGLSQTALDMAAIDNLLEIPQDSVTCKARAKRGCATHPRSIAERERRTRISGKLKKLQDLVPNMDKQTSYADMLDLAVQHIKGLQNQVQNLHKELDNCTCGCKHTR